MSFPATFASLQEQVVQKGRLDELADLDKVQDWINNAYFTACIETDFYESSSVDAPLDVNATSVAVPDSIVKIEYIVPTGSDGTVWGPMQEVLFDDLLEVRAWQGGVISTGAPTRYAFRSSASPTIEFWPTALGGEVLTFYGLSLPTPLASDDDLPIFPEPYSKVIEYGALIHASEFKKDLLMLQTFQAGYEDWLERFRAFNNVRAGAQTMQFKVAGTHPWPRRNDVDQGV